MIDENGDQSYSCIDEPHTVLDDLIPVTPSDEEPVARVDIDVNTLPEHYELGFGFYYRYLFRLPERVDFTLARQNWLAIAGISENGDYIKAEKAGDRVLSLM